MKVNIKSFKRLFLLLVILMSMCNYAYSIPNYNVRVINETDTQVQLQYYDPDKRYTAKILYSKIYLDARVEIYSVDVTLSEADLAYIEYFHSYFLQRYFNMYKCDIADRKIFSSRKDYCRYTFHLYFRA